MGRLENFIPKIQSFKVEGSGDLTLIYFKDHDAFPIDKKVLPFLKQINGHLSLREIFL